MHVLLSTVRGEHLKEEVGVSKLAKYSKISDNRLLSVNSIGYTHYRDLFGWVAVKGSYIMHVLAVVRYHTRRVFNVPGLYLLVGLFLNYFAQYKPIVRYLF